MRFRGKKPMVLCIITLGLLIGCPADEPWWPDDDLPGAPTVYEHFEITDMAGHANFTSRHYGVPVQVRVIDSYQNRVSGAYAHFLEAKAFNTFIVTDSRDAFSPAMVILYAVSGGVGIPVQYKTIDTSIRYQEVLSGLREADAFDAFIHHARAKWRKLNRVGPYAVVQDTVPRLYAVHMPSGRRIFTLRAGTPSDIATLWPEFLAPEAYDIYEMESTPAEGTGVSVRVLVPGNFTRDLSLVGQWRVEDLSRDPQQWHMIYTLKDDGTYVSEEIQSDQAASSGEGTWYYQPSNGLFDVQSTTGGEMRGLITIISGVFEVEGTWADGKPARFRWHRMDE